MRKFKLYEDVLSSSINRYFYEVEANSVEEAVDEILDGNLECYDCDEIYNYEIEPEENCGKPTREIYDDKGKLVWNNAEQLVNRGEIITQSLRNVSKNLALIMKGEPKTFVGGDIAFSIVEKVMTELGWKPEKSITDNYELNYQIYFTKENKDFRYFVSGNLVYGNVIIEKKP